MVPVLMWLALSKSQCPEAPLRHSPCTSTPPAASASVTRGAVSLPSFYAIIYSLHRPSVVTVTWAKRYSPCCYRRGGGRGRIDTHFVSLLTEPIPALHVDSHGLGRFHFKKSKSTAMWRPPTQNRRPLFCP
jgi:hypothetical protein